MKFVILIPILLTGCVATETSEISFTHPTEGTLVVRMARAEVDITKLDVSFDAKNRKVTVKAEKLQTANVETIKAIGSAKAKVISSTGETLGTAGGIAIRKAAGIP